MLDQPNQPKAVPCKPIPTRPTPLTAIITAEVAATAPPTPQAKVCARTSKAEPSARFYEGNRWVKRTPFWSNANEAVRLWVRMFSLTWKRRPRSFNASQETGASSLHCARALDIPRIGGEPCRTRRFSANGFISNPQNVRARNDRLLEKIPPLTARSRRYTRRPCDIHSPPRGSWPAPPAAATPRLP